MTNTNFVIEDEEGASTREDNTATAGATARSKSDNKVLDFFRRAAQRRQIIDDDTLTSRYVITRGRSTNIYSAMQDPDKPIITQHISGDITTKIVAHNNSRQTAKDVVRIAQNANWKSIVLRGNKAFKREAWLQASFNGLAVKGYTPDEQDKANLLQMNSRLADNANVVKKAEGAFSAKVASDPALEKVSSEDKNKLEALFRDRLRDLAITGKISIKDNSLLGAELGADSEKADSVASPQEKTPKVSSAESKKIMAETLKETLLNQLADKPSKKMQESMETEIAKSIITENLPGQLAKEAPSQEKPKAKAKTKPKAKAKSRTKTKGKSPTQ
jgi:hypothetical protein